MIIVFGLSSERETLMCLRGNNDRTNTGKIRRPEREHIRVSLSDDEPVVRNVLYVYYGNCNTINSSYNANDNTVFAQVS